MIIRTYSELRALSSFEDRLDYLKLRGSVSDRTFGSERYLNQRFYTSKEWHDARTRVIARDFGRDLGVEGYEIYDNIVIHHMNPIQPGDLHRFNPDILNPEYLITTSLMTHNDVHYGIESNVPRMINERTPGDTRLW